MLVLAVRQDKQYQDVAICDLCEKQVHAYEYSAQICQGSGLSGLIQPPFIDCAYGSIFDGDRYLILPPGLTEYEGKQDICDDCIQRGLLASYLILDPESLSFKGNEL